MGWRSWNCYHSDINQAKMNAAADAFVDTRRGLSLKEVGYIHVGLDDYYQLCGSGAAG
jgi:alpha-galactosidase